MRLQIQAHVLSIDGKRSINFAYSLYLISKNTQDKSKLYYTLVTYYFYIPSKFCFL